MGDAGSGDEFDRVFDDDFVRGATVSEDDFRKRAKKRHRQARRAHRRRRAAHYAWRVGGVVVIAALALVLAGVAGIGPLSGLRPKDTPATGAVPPTTVRRGTRPGETTTTVTGLQRRTYTRGDCVTWDQHASEVYHDTHVVDCARPHLVEISGRVDVRDKVKVEPVNDAAWAKVIDQNCATSGVALVGGHLDPYGRFAIGAIYPLHDSWVNGDRDLWCDVQMAGARSASTPVSFTGKVEGASQERPYVVGTCLNDKVVEVPCSKPHRHQIIGTVDLSARSIAPADDHAWQQVLQQPCEQFEATVPHEKGTLEWFTVPPGSWAAGARHPACAIDTAGA